MQPKAIYARFLSPTHQILKGLDLNKFGLNSMSHNWCCSGNSEPKRNWLNRFDFDSGFAPTENINFLFLKTFPAPEQRTT